MLLEVRLQVLCTAHEPNPVTEPAMDMTYALPADSLSCTAHFLSWHSSQHLLCMHGKLQILSNIQYALVGCCTLTQLQMPY